MALIRAAKPCSGFLSIIELITEASLATDIYPFHHVAIQLLLTIMNVSGVPGRGYGAGGATAGMNEQEQAMMKAVSNTCKILMTFY